MRLKPIARLAIQLGSPIGPTILRRARFFIMAATVCWAQLTDLKLWIQFRRCRQLITPCFPTSRAPAFGLLTDPKRALFACVGHNILGFVVADPRFLSVRDFFALSGRIFALSD